ncbi:4-dihydromethyltrisporate dehydrogenase [Mycotypha africana]|uniref:4-dihydromethyltrisporate dehydrogenase n=1 Tax=Mycotypha africana TaxID=64632 RepID=UPI002301BE9E|nr:4-dihydromethyltrisporate dehydrogenase [Mycotypha africana]KAI8991263.1 4-dihydromethyltrisporate dehydrogenase [Mycotypha africana]
MPEQVKYDTLKPTGNKIPLVGFGTARIPPEETEEVVYNAIKSGYRMIDGAYLYGNEKEVGKGVRRAIADGIVKREDLFIVGKLWNNFHSAKHVAPIFEKTLDNYEFDYIDLYLVHWPVPSEYIDPKEFLGFCPKGQDLKWERSPMQDCWRELEKLVDAGKIKNIGISNFNCQLILDLLTYARIHPSVLEIELHPYLQQKRLVKWAKKENIHVIAYASLGNMVYDEVPENLKNVPKLMEHETVTKIAKKHNRNPGQILLRWAVQQKITVVPKSVKESRMKSNLDVFCFELDDEDMKDLESLNINARFNDLVENMYGFELPIFE